LKNYECLYIVNINYDSEGTSAVAARVEEVLKNVGAEVVNTQHWGKRKLAYAIDKERYGNYILLHFQGENPDISELQREFEIEKGVLHYMTIRLDEFPDFETLSVPKAYEPDRKRHAPAGGRRPNRYDEDRPARDQTPDSKDPAVSESDAETPAEVDTDVDEAGKADVAESSVEEQAEADTAEEVEVTEEAESIETPEEVMEDSGDSDESETPEKAEEQKSTDDSDKESTAETSEDEADKPADTE